MQVAGVGSSNGFVEGVLVRAARWTGGWMLALAMAAARAAGADAGAVAAPSPGPYGAAIDWSAVQPVASVSVHALTAADAPAQYRDRADYCLVEGRIIDVRSGETLMEPRLILRRGDPASIEVGRADRVVMKLTVHVAETGGIATTTTELRNAGVLTSSSTTRFVLAGL